MNQQTKIILGLGAVGIGLYLYNKNKKSKSVTSDVVTPPTGGGSLSPAPVPMPTPIPDIPKKEEGTTSVYYCKDGTRQVQTTYPNVKMQNPCNNRGGIDEAKTKKNMGESKARGGVLAEGSPCEHNEFLAQKPVEGRERGGGVIKSAGIIRNGACEKICPKGQEYRRAGVSGNCVPIGSNFGKISVPNNTKPYFPKVGSF